MSIPWLDTVSSALGRFPATPFLAIAAAFGFFHVHQGHIGGAASAVAYAEAIHHQVGPTAPGRIAEVRVQVGQVVKAGEPMIVMDDRALQLSKIRAVTQLAKLRADELAATLDEESKVTRSELWVLKAKADEQSDRAELEEVARQMERLGGLLERQMVPAAEAESAREKLRMLEARVETYDKAIGSGRAGFDRGLGSGHKKSVETRLEPYRQAVLVQQAAIKQLDQQLDELTIRAPVDGVVSALVHRHGDVVAAAAEVVSLVTSRPGTVTVIVPESSAARVTLGEAAELRRDKLLARPLAGRVVELSPEVEEIPLRARPSPSIAAWGRRATIEISGGEPILPGEAFHVAFR